MRKTLIAGLLCAALSCAAAAQSGHIVRTQLKVGQKAPDFTLLDDHFQPVSLHQFRGKQKVILAIYLLAFTPG